MRINGVQWDASTCTYSTCLSPHSLHTAPQPFPALLNAVLLWTAFEFSITIDTHSTARCVQSVWGTLCHFRVLCSHSGWCQIPPLPLPGYVTASFFTAHVCYPRISFSWSYLKRYFPSCPQCKVSGVSVYCDQVFPDCEIWKLPWLVTETCACFPEAAVCSLHPSLLPHSPHDYLRLSFISALRHIQAARWKL